jgi:hypothetical protein
LRFTRRENKRISEERRIAGSFDVEVLERSRTKLMICTELLKEIQLDRLPIPVPQVIVSRRRITKNKSDVGQAVRLIKMNWERRKLEVSNCKKISPEAMTFPLPNTIPALQNPKTFKRWKGKA